MGTRDALIRILAIFLLCQAASPVLADVFSGRITESGSGLPLGNALVQVGNSTSPAYADRTDAGGYYTIPDVPAATDYTVIASAPGHASAYILMQSPGVVNLALPVPASGCLTRTLYRGDANYACDAAGCTLVGGTVTASTGTFPDIDAHSPQIDALLASIGAGATPPATAEELWNKCRRTWQWLQANAVYNPGDPTYEAAQDFLMANGWPSIQRIAETFQAYGFVPWGTCMSRAQMFTTLLCRTGISRNDLAICESPWKLRYSQHMYTGVRLLDRWIFLDPTYNHLSIPAFAVFTSIPLSGGVADYCHPIKLTIIPGASIGGVPELSRRTANSPQVYMVQPPTGTRVLDETVTVSGVAPDPAATTVRVAGVAWPVVAGAFSAVVPLACGDNEIVAEVTLPGGTFADTIVVQRWCRSDLDWDGDVDAEDFDILASCLSGPDATPTCDPFVVESADRDADDDLDLHDFGIFQTEFAGPQ